MTPEPTSDHAQPPLGEVGRITGVFLDPKKAFADIAARPSWILPVALLIVIALTFVYTYSTRVGWERYIRQTMENNPRVQNLPADQRETQIQAGAKFAPILGYAGAVVGTVLIILIVGGVMVLMCKMVGASVTFKQMFAISAWARLPGFLGGILAIVVMYTKDPEAFDLKNPLPFFNLGVVLEPPPPGSGKFLYTFATSIDIFTIWSILLLAVGISVAARKVPFSKAVMLVGIPWIVWVLVASGFAGMFG